MQYDEFWPGGPVFLHGEGFSIGTDAVMLYAFCKNIRAKNVCDFGCGSGVIGQLLAFSNQNITVTGIEIQSSSAEAAIKNAEANLISHRFSVINGDLRQYKMLLPAGGYDLIVMNPPYYPAGSGKTSAVTEKAIARDERMCTLTDACRAAAYAVKWGGRFCMVHKPERTGEIIYTMHKNGLEPKRMRFVQHSAKSKPNLVLIESLRGGNPGLIAEAPLILTDEAGGDTPEVIEIYHRQPVH